MSRKKERVDGYNGIHPHILRNIALMLMFLVVFAVLGQVFTPAILWSLVDIADHLEAWIAAYVMSVVLTVMAIGLDGLMSLAMMGIFVPVKRFLRWVWRLAYVLFRFIVIGTQLIAMVMGAVMAMRIAQAPVAALIIALHLALALTGYMGVRNMEKMLKEEQGQ